MLHLQAGVDLHEIELAVGIDDELHRARIRVVDRLRSLHRSFAHGHAQGRRQERRRRFLQHLLVAALGGALALVEVQGMAVRVGEHLDLDVARPLQVLLDQHAVVTEARRRLALARGQRGGELARRVDHPHALAAAAGAGLDQHRVADAIGFALQERGVLLGAVVARHQRHAGLLHQRLRFALAAHRADRRRGGPK